MSVVWKCPACGSLLLGQEACEGWYEIADDGTTNSAHRHARTTMPSYGPVAYRRWLKESVRRLLYGTKGGVKPRGFFNR